MENNRKNAIILHGIGDSPESYWYPYIKKHLEQRGFSVWSPELPEKDNPQLSVQVPFLLAKGTYAPETVIIGHSSACAVILGLLERLTVQVKQVIFVSGFIEAKGPRAGITGVIKEFDWEGIKKHVRDFIFINSDNDPWGCTEEQGLKMLHYLGGTLIVRHGEGHMGSGSYNQPYKEFPFLLKLID